VGVRVEFTVEPFVVGAPGAHVLAAVDAAAARGLAIDFGPFGSAVEGDPVVVLPAIEVAIRAALEAGATRVSVQVSRMDEPT
jgi:uncharacterized protein YqgV (UPF0045/DUF77 family)